MRQRFDLLQEQFGKMDSSKFEDIKAKIHKSAEAYEGAGYSQDEIIGRLSDWILSNCGYNQEYKYAARIIVAFFIRICEVFHAIS